ncbi:Gfo/Idh/MocA family oxidoreductase [Amycolatopsis sp. NPDC051372]|uniref:Gfo/Idh/MocA family protein n=1 Tax=Amycolatopsis sp. NPDC051372 TaxID=3155669 RepID=UPI003426C630
MDTSGLGIAGWGAAGRLMADAVTRASRFRLAGVADVDPAAREHAGSETGCRTYEEVASLAAAEDVDVVYIATPTFTHGPAIREVAAHGKHVISEKPLATTLAEAQKALEAAERAGVNVLVGATHSYNAPVRVLRRIVEDARLGPLLSVCTTCHTDWHRRPRSASDLDAAQGNGLVLRQGAHQIDILRYLCGGLTKSVAGTTFGGSDGTELGFTAQLAFPGGVHASAYYSGTGGFDSRVQTWGVGELGTFDVAPTPTLSRHFVLPGQRSVSPVFGTLVATFAAGGAWVTPSGVLVFAGGEVTEIGVEGEPSGWDALLDETADALDGHQTVHTGRWGMATLEVGLALHESARTGLRVDLHHQIGTALLRTQA